MSTARTSIGRCGRGVDGVDVRERPRLVRPADQLRDRVDRPDRVRRPAEGDEPRPLVEDRVEALEVQGDVVGADVDRAQLEAAVGGHAPPGSHVRLVVERGHDDPVAGLERRRERPGDMHRQRRHVRAELDLLRVGGVDEVREGRVGVGDQRVAAARGQELAAVVGVRRAVVLDDRVDHRLRDLRAARAVEQRDRDAVLLDREGREPGAQRLDVELGHRVLAWGVGWAGRS